MRYKIIHTTTYTYSDAVPICHNEVHLIPRDAARQACLYNRLRIKPRPTVLEQRIDYFGNRVTNFAIEQAHQKLTVVALSRVHVTAAPPAIEPEQSAAWEDIRDALASYSDLVEVYQFVFDSALAKSSAALRDYALPSFPPRRPIVAGALDLCQRIHREFIYDPKATTVSTPLPVVLELRRGVCQDFAHLAIGCLRSLGLAARYVSGYLLTRPPEGKPRLVGSDASHAWLSVYTGNSGWLDIDPTNNVVPSLEHITLAWGRDYSDVCPIQGVFIGGGQHGLNVSVDVSPIASTGASGRRPAVDLDRPEHGRLRLKGSGMPAKHPGRCQATVPADTVPADLSRPTRPPSIRMSDTELIHHRTPAEPLPDNLRSVQPGGGVCYQIELAWGRWRRWYLKRLRPRYVEQMAALRQGDPQGAPHEILDCRDLKYCRNQCTCDWEPVDDPFRWREWIPFARWGLAELQLMGWPLLAVTRGAGLLGFLVSGDRAGRGAGTDRLFLSRSAPPRADRAGAGRFAGRWPRGRDHAFGSRRLHRRAGRADRHFSVDLQRPPQPAPARSRVIRMRYSPGLFLNAMNPRKCAAERKSVDRPGRSRFTLSAADRAANCRPVRPADRMQLCGRTKPWSVARNLA